MTLGFKQDMNFGPFGDSCVATVDSERWNFYRGITLCISTGFDAEKGSLQHNIKNFMYRFAHGEIGLHGSRVGFHCTSAWRRLNNHNCNEKKEVKFDLWQMSI